MSSPYILKTKQYDCVIEFLHEILKGRLLSVIQMHQNLVVPIEAIYKETHLVNNRAHREACLSWTGEAIF